jgi:uncharacterized membrane protein
MLMLIPSLGGLAPPVRLSSPAPKGWGAVIGWVEVEGLATWIIFIGLA